MAAEQHLRLAGAAAAARRRHQPDGEQAGRGADVDPRAAGAAPAESVVQQLSFGDRSARVRAGEFRRHRRMADDRRIGQAGRRQRHDGERRRRSTGWPACGRCCSSSPSSFRARSPRSCWPTRSAGGSSTTISRRCERSSATRRRTTTAGRRSILGIVEEPDVSDADVRASATGDRTDRTRRLEQGDER